ncbi:MAG: hypothetical protein CL933_23845 [Deltaproteobacteria bacterium]|nr:hypothetical protein [Deltaproteobacteria bacterium]
MAANGAGLTLANLPFADLNGASLRTSRMFPVCSASFKIPMIRSSVNHFRLISPPIGQKV